MYTCGIDVGSVSTKVVILGKKDNKIASYVIAPTGSDGKNAAIKALDDSLKKAGLTDNEIEATVATGYGRINIPFADQNITEISCHTLQVKTIIKFTLIILPGLLLADFLS